MLWAFIFEVFEILCQNVYGQQGKEEAVIEYLCMFSQKKQKSTIYINLAFNIRYCLNLYEGFKRKENQIYKVSEVTEWWN